MKKMESVVVSKNGADNPHDARPQPDRHIKVETTFSPKKPQGKQYKTVLFDVMPNGERLTGDLKWRFYKSESEAKEGHEKVVEAYRLSNS